MVKGMAKLSIRLLAVAVIMGLIFAYSLLPLDSWCQAGWTRTKFAVAEIRTGIDRTPYQPPSPPSPPKIFYFGVTVSKNHNKAIACQETWARRSMENFTWFSDKPEPRLGNVVIIVPPSGSDYGVLTARINMIWKYVWENLNHSEYSWFSRTWDDNFIIPEEMTRIASKYNSSELVEIGRFGEYAGNTYIGGGASSIVSRALVKAHIESGKVASMNPTFEDYTVSMVRRELGATFKLEPGFLHLPPHINVTQKDWAKIRLSELACHCLYKEVDRPSFTLPVTFHYVQPEWMHSIYRAYYEEPCLLPIGSQESNGSVICPEPNRDKSRDPPVTIV